MIRFIALIAALMQSPAEAQSLTASWYDQGTITASGEKFDPKKMTAAHRHYAFGTKLKLRYKERKVTVTINDRGPFKKGRSLDLSKGAARQIGLTGLGRVEILAVIPAKKKRV